MNPALYAILLNALAVCMSHQPDLRKPVFDAGFEQCAVVEPAAQKAEVEHYAPAVQAQERADKEALTSAVAALEKIDRAARATDAP